MEKFFSRSRLGRVYELAFCVLCVLLLLGIVVLNLPSLENLYTRWSYEEEYGYGFLALGVFLYLLVFRWKYLLSHRKSFFVFGYVPLLFGLVLSLVGDLSSSYYLNQVSVIISVFGLCVLYLGGGKFWEVLSIFLLLFLAVPLPYTLQAILTVNLQLVSTWVGVWFIQLSNIPVYVEGNVIDLGLYKLQVAEACSGLQYFYSLICLSYMAVLLFDNKLYKKVLIVAFSVPLAIFLNGLRIALAGYLTHWYGAEMAKGFIHIFQGWVIFSLGIGVLLAVLWRIGGISEVRLTTNQQLSAFSRTGAKHVVLLMLILITFFLFQGYIERKVDQSVILRNKPLVTFPDEISSWSGEKDKLSNKELDILRPDDYLLSRYTSGDYPGFVELYVVYYQSMDKGFSIHSPRVCLPGGGWEFKSIETVETNLLPGDEPVEINRIVIKKDSSTQLLYYWYDQRGRIFSDEFAMKWYLLVDSVLKGRKDGSLVRISTPIAGSETLADGEERLQDFMKGSALELIQFVPR